jgi:large subunit ribosomal protein L4e
MKLKVNILDINGKVARTAEVASRALNRKYREDIIKRALVAEQSRAYQPQGHYLLAGMQTTAEYIGEYGVYRTGRHMGIAIRPRQKLAGGAMGYVRKIPSSVKGRRAHPHRIEKRIKEDISAKEYRFAVESALAASSDKKLMAQSHKIEDLVLPVIIEDRIESIGKTKDLLKLMNAIGLGKDLELSRVPRTKEGMRRRQKRRYFRSSAIIIVGKEGSKIFKAGRNIPGVKVSSVGSLRVEDIAPGAKPRIIIWSEGALGALDAAVEHIRLK